MMECHVRVLNAGHVFRLPFLPQKSWVQWNMAFFCKGNGLLGWTYGPVGISKWNVSAVALRCRKAIMEGELRIGLEAPEDDHRGSQLGWYHPSCLWKTFSFQKNANKKRLEKKQHTNQNIWNSESWLFGRWRRIMEMGGVI